MAIPRGRILDDTAERKRPSPFYGWLCIALAGYPIALAFGWIAADRVGLLSPNWLVGLCGIVFLLGGLMILVGHRSRWNDLLAGAMAAAFAAMAGWVSVFGPSEGFSGGLPFLSPETNVALARMLFGAGSLICILIAAHALRRFRGGDA